MRRGMPLEQFVKWQRIIRRILTAVVVGATLLVAWADHHGWLLEHGRAWVEQVTSFKIVKILRIVKILKVLKIFSIMTSGS